SAPAPVPGQRKRLAPMLRPPPRPKKRGGAPLPRPEPGHPALYFLSLLPINRDGVNLSLPFSVNFERTGFSVRRSGHDGSDIHDGHAVDGEKNVAGLEACALEECRIAARPENKTGPALTARRERDASQPLGGTAGHTRRGITIRRRGLWLSV